MSLRALGVSLKASLEVSGEGEGHLQIIISENSTNGFAKPYFRTDSGRLEDAWHNPRGAFHKSLDWSNQGPANGKAYMHACCAFANMDSVIVRSCPHEE